MTRHIVTTDDDPAIRKVLQIMLRKEGYHVSSCQDGEELRNFLASEADSVDLILLDIKMPGLSGFEVLEIVQRTHPRIPIVMLTAFNDLDTGMKAIRMGAADYLAKPVRREALVSCVERVIEKSDRKWDEEVRRNTFLSQQQKLERELQEALTTLHHATRATLEAFSETIEQKDAYTKGHCSRVRSISIAMGKALDLPEPLLQIIEGGSLLHDIGKIGIPEDILNKTTPLTDREMEIIKGHPESGERIVAPIEMFQAYRPIIRNHHERMDGSGYPDRLVGEMIPLEVRIVSLADAFDAMTTDRAYRPALPTEIAVEEIKSCSGSQFDPDLVNLFLDRELYSL